MFADPLFLNARFTLPSVSPRDWLNQHAADLNSLPSFGVDGAFRARRLFSAWGHFQRALLDHYWERRGFDDWGRFERSLAQVSLSGARTALEGLSVENVDGWRRELGATTDLITNALPEAIWLTPGRTFIEAAFTVAHAERDLAWGRHWRRQHPERKLCVIGLRGEGEGTAAAVALGARSAITPITLRLKNENAGPRVSMSPSCAGYLRRQPRAVYFAIVEEGEDLRRGEAALLRQWLEDNGVAPARIHLPEAQISEPKPAAH